MRGIYQVSTGNLIQATSASDDETLTNNAINAGYSADDLELRDIADLEAELARLNPPTWEQKNADVLAAINKIETTKQTRALREAALNQPGAADRLAKIDAEIAALRAQLVK